MHSGRANSGWWPKKENRGAAPAHGAASGSRSNPAAAVEAGRYRGAAHGREDPIWGWRGRVAHRRQSFHGSTPWRRGTSVLGQTRGHRSRWSGRRATRRRWGARRDSSRAALWQEAATFGVALSVGKGRWRLLELMVGEAVKGDGERHGEQHGTVAMVLAATIVLEGGQRALSSWMCSADTAATRVNRSGRWLGLKTGHPLGT
jgi:hypothetical protein